MHQCFACDKVTKNPDWAITSDGQTVYVGSDCWRRICKAGKDGYQPPKGGPRLYRVWVNPQGKVFKDARPASANDRREGGGNAS